MLRVLAQALARELGLGTCARIDQALPAWKTPRAGAEANLVWQLRGDGTRVGVDGRQRSRVVIARCGREQRDLIQSLLS
jgi:hypothetical protein